MQLPTKQTRVEAQLSILKCVIRIGFPVVLRTDGRTKQSNVITLPKFLALVGYQFLYRCGSVQAPSSRGARQRKCFRVSTTVIKFIAF